MDTLEAIRSRRAVKSYDSTHRFTSEEEARLIDLAMQTPSSFNIQHWRIVNIVDPELRKEIRGAAFDQAQVTDASLLFVLTADQMAWSKEPQRYWRNAPEDVQNMLVPWMAQFYEGDTVLQRDEAMRSIGLIAQTIMIAARGMGYDSCPMIGFDRQAVAKMINLPHDHVIGMMIAIGKAMKPAWPKPGFISKDELVIRDRFPA